MPAPSSCRVQVGALTFGKLKAIESEAAATPAQAEGRGSGKTSAQKDSADIGTPDAGTEQQEPVPEVAPYFHQLSYYNLHI